MKVTRRRARKLDPFASRDWVHSIFDHLKSAFPGISSYKEKDLIRLARAVRHVERYSATDTRRGRPSRWPREDLLKVGSSLSGILARETQGRISLATFVDHYLRILCFPPDVMEALARCNINLFEAEQLSRITPERLGITAAEAQRKRGEVLGAHLKSMASGERLRRRVNEMLGCSSNGAAPSAPSGSQAEDVAGMEDFDPYDSTHLFWEEIKQLGFAFREIRQEDLTDELIEELLRVSQPVWAVLAKIRRRKQEPQREKLIF